MNTFGVVVVATVAAAFVGLQSSGVQAAARDKIQLVVPTGLCAAKKNEMATWSKSSVTGQYTVYAAPRLKEAKKLNCDAAGPETTVGISTSADKKLASKAALAKCNEMRGLNGSCQIIGIIQK